MARNRKRKTQIGTFTEAQMKEAVQLVIEENIPIRRAAEMQMLSHVTLFGYVQKVKNNPVSEILFRPNYNVRLIFKIEEENTLVNYLLTSSKMCYGLIPVECRKLAYEAAVKNNKVIPENWKTHKMAGLEWYLGFRKRHPELSCRKPESCSLSRATSFNKHNVGTFFKTLQNVLEREPRFRDGTRIFNLDETGTTTVQAPPKILAKKGMKQVSQCTSGERGALVTTCSIICAAGYTLPPAMIFPRVHFKEIMTNDAPTGTLGLATPSGWMNRDLFPHVIKHFIKYSCSSLDTPSLLLMDNHESHLSLETLDIAKDNGVTILTIPPHCSHKIQPLDVAVFSSFKAHYNNAMQCWLLNHPGIPVTIFNIASFVKIAHERSMVPNNITSGFRNTGIFPFDPEIFSEEDFLVSAVTDRPEEHPEELTLAEERQHNIPNTSNISTLEEHNYIQSTSSASISVGKDTIINKSSFISPEVFRGYPKAKKRKIQKSTRKGKTIIATDTPERDAIAAKEENKVKPKASAVKKIKRNLVGGEKRLVTKVKVNFIKDDSTDEEEDWKESSSDSEWVPEEPLPDFDTELTRPPVENDFVLVQFQTKKCVYYVGKILKAVSDKECEVSFMKKSPKIVGKFFFPAIPDISSVDISDIKLMLPKPSLFGSTSRQNEYMSCEINFGSLDVR